MAHVQEKLSAFRLLFRITAGCLVAFIISIFVAAWLGASGLVDDATLEIYIYGGFGIVALAGIVSFMSGLAVADTKEYRQYRSNRYR